MSHSRKKTVQITVKVPEDSYQSLRKLAASKHITLADVVRGFIDKGLSVQSYEENIDLIATIIRQEIRAQLDVQIDRIAKMIMKIGKISAGLYYLIMKLLLRQYGSTRSQSLKELATETRKMGIKYMQMRDFQINDYLEDDDMIYNDAELL